MDLRNKLFELADEKYKKFQAFQATTKTTN